MKEEEKKKILGILEGFGFNVSDYVISNGEKVLADVIRECDSKSDIDIKDADTQNYIIRHLERLYYIKMGTVSIWNSDISSGVADCYVEGKRYRGKALIKPKEITVTLLIGEEGRTLRSVILPNSGINYTVEPFEGSPANSYGKECAKHLFYKLIGFSGMSKLS